MQKTIWKFITLFTVAISIPNISSAMDFKVFYVSDWQRNVIVAEGEIEDGDADKFNKIYSKADRDEENDITLILNSSGGSVLAALELAEVIDKVGVFTMVPPEAICASACATIVYTAGNRRDLMEGGLLGFHTCYTSDGKTVEKSSFCNEAIAERAMRNGLDYASVSLFANSYDPGEMAWIGRKVACKFLFGMCRKSLKKDYLEAEEKKRAEFIKEMFNEFSKSSPSFSCKKAQTIQEEMICSDGELARLDRVLAKKYSDKISNSKQPNNVRIEQRAWLRYSRDACKDEQCLLESYKLRVEELASR